MFVVTASRIRMRACAGLLLFCFAAIGAHAQTPPPSAPPPLKPGGTPPAVAAQAGGQRLQATNPVAPTRKSVRSGGKIYLSYCTNCHGHDGEASSVGARKAGKQVNDLTESVPALSDSELAAIIADGRGTMPATKNQLEERRIWDIVNYLRYAFPAGKAAAPPVLYPGGPGDMQMH